MCKKCDEANETYIQVRYAALVVHHQAVDLASKAFNEKCNPLWAIYQKAKENCEDRS